MNKFTKDGRRLYWAYGANLSKEAMAHRCPRAIPSTKLVVHSAALVFRGVADVEIRRGSVVQGGLWWITAECEAALDRFEGVSGGLYVKRYLPVWKMKHSGKQRKALFYQMQIAEGMMPPSRHYVETIAQGYQDFGLDLAFLDAAIEEAWTNKKVTPFLRRRYVEKGSPRLQRAGDAYA